MDVEFVFSCHPVDLGDGLVLLQYLCNRPRVSGSGIAVYALLRCPELRAIY